MAKVTAQDREKTGFKDDKSYPMNSAAQIRSAIKLRHHGKGHTAMAVLEKASGAVARLLKAGKISPGEAKRLRNLITQAHQMDRARKKGE